MRRSAIAGALGLALATAAIAVPSPATALPIGNTLTIVSSTNSMTTGKTWTVVAEVDDLLGSPVSGATVFTGIVEPSAGCGNDLTAATCTALATDTKGSDANGQVTLSRAATLNTFVVFYLSDSAGALDPTTGKSVLVHTHNAYDWSGPSTATLKQYAIGDTPYMIAPGMPGARVTMASGSGAATTLLTQVSSDGGTTWKTVGRGTNGGAFPITGRKTALVDRVNLMASKPGTYSVRITDNGGKYEDPGVSPVVTITVSASGTPEWLRRTNEYRASLGLAPVADNPVYDAAVAKHVHWMDLHNTLSHSETPGSAGYSKDGNLAAASSDLAFGNSTATGTVDGWIGAPFHASCLLNAYWAVGGFAMKNGWAGEWCHSDLQTLDLATGTNGPVRASLRRNFTFPSAAMPVPVSIASNGSEAPDPVAGCRSRGVGPSWAVPVIFRVARPPASDRGLANARAVLKTSSGRRLTHTCLLTGTTYRGPDSGTTQLGRLILGNSVTGRWAVLLAKAGSLRAGHTYAAALTDGKLSQRTKFTLARH
jgi:uncharacterized protein YkwD